MGEHSPRFVSHRSLRPPSSTWRGRFRESKRFVRNNSFPQLWLIFQRQIFVRLIELREEATWQKFKRTLKQEVQLKVLLNFCHVASSLSSIRRNMAEIQE